MPVVAETARFPITVRGALPTERISGGRAYVTIDDNDFEGVRSHDRREHSFEELRWLEVMRFQLLCYGD